MVSTEIFIKQEVTHRRKMVHENLEKKWKRLSNELALDKSLYNQFHYWYTHPPRAYHNLSHISDCLHEFDNVRSLASEPSQVEIALWFHDAIYYPMAKDNEEESAELAGQILDEEGISKSYIKGVKDLILLTKHNTTPATIDGKIIVDIDLFILGKPEDIFDQYNQNVIKEYEEIIQTITWDRFKEGRIKILKRFLERPSIYYTGYFKNKYEIQAIKNLERAILSLEK